jgi:hypothetical protein
MNSIDRQRFEQDLWPQHKKRHWRKAIKAREGAPVRISLGEAETLASREVEREVRRRLAGK